MSSWSFKRILCAYNIYIIYSDDKKSVYEFITFVVKKDVRKGERNLI